MRSRARLMLLTLGTAKAWTLLGRIKPGVVVGFGGYPTVPPLLAASWRAIPTVLHEQNGVMGRANTIARAARHGDRDRLSHAQEFQSSLAEQDDVHRQPAFVRKCIAAATTPYVPPAAGELRLLVFGGSQGARVMARDRACCDRADR